MFKKKQRSQTVEQNRQEVRKYERKIKTYVEDQLRKKLKKMKGGKLSMCLEVLGMYLNNVKISRI